jgi:hypothetical protein
MSCRRTAAGFAQVVDDRAAGYAEAVDAGVRYYRVEEHPTPVMVRGLHYSLWVVLCSGLLDADRLRVAAGLLLVPCRSMPLQLRVDVGGELV